MRLVFATNNKHKLEEARQILGNRHEVLSLSEIGCSADIPETAETLEGNSLLKAQYVWEHFGLSCFADDTGLEIDALHGAPGVYTARYAGQPSNDALNRAKVLAEMMGVENRAAQFRTAVTLIIDGKTHVFEGICKGKIAQEESGTSGFGYDPIFIPEGYVQTFAELSSGTKNEISHRGRALELFSKFIENQ